MIAGSGYIAVELAGVFNGLGSDVGVVVRKDGIVRSFDAMLGAELMQAMREDGIRMETRVIPASLEKTDDGILMHAEDGRTFGPVDCVLWAIGREPNIEGLELANAGVETDAMASFRSTTISTPMLRIFSGSAM